MDFQLLIEICFVALIGIPILVIEIIDQRREIKLLETFLDIKKKEKEMDSIPKEKWMEYLYGSIKLKEGEMRGGECIKKNNHFPPPIRPPDGRKK